MAELSVEKKAKHTKEAVYGKVDGGNSEITFDAVDKSGKRIPVTTKKFNREESHFVFGEAKYQEDKSSSVSSGE